MTRKTASIAVVLAFLAASAAMPGRAATTFSATFIGGATGYEPGITVSPAGTLFVNEPTGTHSLYRLADVSGAKWTKATFPSPQNRYEGGFDSDAITGHDGTVYEFDLSVASNTLYRSDDDGLTWSWSSPVTTIPLDDRAWITIGPKTASGETVYATWTDLVTGYVMFARSEDSGVTWLTQGPQPGFLGAAGDTGKPVADDTGFVGIPYFDTLGGLSLMTSPDRGATWHGVQITDGPVFHVMQDIAKLGHTLYTTWIDGTDYSVKYARSTDDGETWSAPLTIAPAGSDVYPWLAARGDKVSIAWYRSTEAAPTDPNSVSASTQWFVNYAESIDGGLSFSAPVAAYSSPSLKGPVCTNGIGCDTSGNSAARQLGDFLSVTIDAHGAARIAAAVHGGVGKQGLVVLSQG